MSGGRGGLDNEAADRSGHELEALSIGRFAMYGGGRPRQGAGAGREARAARIGSKEGDAGVGIAIEQAG